MNRVLLLLAIAALIGCQQSVDPTLDQVSQSQETESTDIESLVTRTLDTNFKDRMLSTEIHGAWQVLHGILAFGQDFRVHTPDGEKPAVQYLLQGGPLPGFRPRLGHTFSGRPGLKVDLEPNQKVGQGHRDQWLAVMAQSGLDASTIIKSGGLEFTMRDWVNQVQWDSPPSIDESEYSWTLIALAAYNDTDSVWLSRDDNRYNMESLLKSEVQSNLRSSACGGTHRLIGIAMALQKRRAEGKPVAGVWQEAENKISMAIDLAKQNQNPDGSYSSAYMHRTGWTRDLGESLGSTGHVLEFIAIAADDETLRSAWVERSARRVCAILEQCKRIDLECGALYHALHGLVEYRDRLKRIRLATN